MKSGVEIIAEERDRQIYDERWNDEHDDQHIDGQLAEAAACYARAHNSDAGTGGFWPWDMKWWKPKDRTRNLARAGALIAAEIDRIQRAST